MGKVLSSATAAKLAELLRRPHAPPARAALGAAPLPWAVTCGTLIGTTPRPHYECVVQWVPDLDGPTDAAGATDGILADLNGGTLTPGRTYRAHPSGADGGDSLFWAENGDVRGPSSATDTAVAVFDGTTGTVIKAAAVTVAPESGETLMTFIGSGGRVSFYPGGATFKHMNGGNDLGLIEQTGGTFNSNLYVGGLVAYAGISADDVYAESVYSTKNPSTLLTEFGATNSTGGLLFVNGLYIGGSFSGGTGTVTSINLTAPAAGITVSGGPVTGSGAITLSLANDLAAVEGLSGAGLAVRTAADTWAVRTITGTTDKIDVTNGSGAGGNPTLTIASTYAGQTSITTLGTVSTGTWDDGTW